MTDHVAYLEIQLLEPLAVRGSYGRGNFYRVPSYIPSSTLTGAILNKFYLSGRGRANEVHMWSSHAFPGDPPELGNPPALPLATLSTYREASGSSSQAVVSVALFLAKAMREGPDILKEIEELDPKVGEKFAKVVREDRGVDVSTVSPPLKEFETHVTLDYRHRTHAIMEGGSDSEKGAKGLLFSQEVILPFGREGPESEEECARFHALAFLSSDLLDFIDEGIELRLGSMRSKGYGLAWLTVNKKRRVAIDEYRRQREQHLSNMVEEDWLTVDVLGFARPGLLTKASLGNPTYSKVELVDVKFWYKQPGQKGQFHLYRNVLSPRSVLVFENPLKSGSLQPSKLVDIETTPPSNQFDALHGLDMVFFDNPVHFVSFSRLVGGGI